MKYDKLYWEAFWAFYGGVMLLLSCFLLLPMIMGLVHFGAANMSVLKFTVFGTVGLACLALVAIWTMITLATCNMSEGARIKELQILAKEGRSINPVHWVFILAGIARYACRALSIPDEEKFTERE